MVHPQEQFYLHQFMEELHKAFHEIRSRNNLPIICGGTGLYLDALRKDFSLTQVKENEPLRRELLSYDKQQLLDRLDTYPDALTKQVDRSSVKRLIRGIEIAEYCLENKFVPEKKELPYQPYYIGIAPSLAERKQRISDRLQKRLEVGLIEEVKKLLGMGISAERLELLGLEYKFVLHFLQNRISREELFHGLQTAIFQFARRQMTWFRKMEKEGVLIHWINPEENPEILIKQLKTIF
jgi:tRNA dimethylallyltransferase